MVFDGVQIYTTTAAEVEFVVWKSETAVGGNPLDGIIILYY